MKTLIINSMEDQDYKVVKTLLDRLGIEYTQRTRKEIKEVEDPEALRILQASENDKVLSVSETKNALREIGLNV